MTVFRFSTVTRTGRITVIKMCRIRNYYNDEMYFEWIAILIVRNKRKLIEKLYRRKDTIHNLSDEKKSVVIKRGKKHGRMYENR